MKIRSTLPFLLAATLAPAQMSMPMDNAPDTRPVPLVAGLGNAKRPIRTTSPEAQKFFNQGMDYLFAFNHDEARRSFQKAADLDPHAPMPLWGVALAVGPNYNDIDIGHARELQAYTAITKAKELAATDPTSQTNTIEADYVEALATRYALETNHDLKVQGERYAKAMAALVAKHPDDLDAATLYAESLMDLHPWQLWTSEGKPAPNTQVETIVATLQSVLLRNPNHVGANHFLIHAVEASADPLLALPSAKRLENLTPAAGHLVHMPAHIYQRVGNFNSSAIANRRAIVADDAYIKSQHLTGVVNMYDTMYLVHNIHFLASSCSMEGNSACAASAAARLVNHVTPGVPQSHQSEWYLPTQVWVMVRFHRWNQILAHPMPSTDMPYLTAMFHYARASAYTALNKPEQAQAERKLLVDAIQALPPDAIPDFNNSAKSVLELALTVLDARIAESPSESPSKSPSKSKPDRAAAVALWQKAVITLDTFAYNEPADWYYPVRESLGGAYLRNHQPTEAEAVFRRDLQQNPGNGRSLYGLWQSLLQQKKASDAALVKTQFEAAWKNSDTPLKIEDL